MAVDWGERQAGEGFAAAVLKVFGGEVGEGFTIATSYLAFGGFLIKNDDDFGAGSWVEVFRIEINTSLAGIAEELVDDSSTGTDDGHEGVEPALLVAADEVEEAVVVIVLFIGVEPSGSAGFADFLLQELVVDRADDVAELFEHVVWHVDFEKHGASEALGPDHAAIVEVFLVLILGVGVVVVFGPVLEVLFECWPAFGGPVDEEVLVEDGGVSQWRQVGVAVDEVDLVGVKDAVEVGGVDLGELVDDEMGLVDVTSTCCS